MNNCLVPIAKDQTITHQVNEKEFNSDESLSFTLCTVDEDLLFSADKMPCRPILQTYDWVKDLTQKNYEVAPVQCFRYVCSVVKMCKSFEERF